MLDIKFIREHPKEVKESQKKRGISEKNIDALLGLDEKWRKLKLEVDNLRSDRNKVSKEINEAKKQGRKVDELLKRAKEIPLKLQEKEKFMSETVDKRNSLLKEIPNIIDKSVPVGDASKNKVLKSYGKPKKLKFNAKDHADLLTNLDCLDTKKASEVSGSRFYYLKNDLVKLNYALINFALDVLKKKEFVLVQPPFMLRKEILEMALNLNSFKDAIYKIDEEDLYLIGTAEHALNAYHSNEILNLENPIRLAGISSCFRKEAGTHGKDEKGIFRAHQFEKVEQFIFSKPENSWKEFDLLLNNTIEIFKALEIPFRTIILASGDTGFIPTKTIDLEGWFPSQKTYRELGSCSNCLDYQARRANTRYQDKKEVKFVHTLNNTAIATERMIACIVENNQQKDGSISIPKALQKYTGFKVIKPKIAKKANKKAKNNSKSERKV